MKIYVSTRGYLVPFKRHFLRPAGMAVEILAVSLLTENGFYYVGVNKDFDLSRLSPGDGQCSDKGLPPTGEAWKSLGAITREVNQFIDFHGGDAEIEFISHQCWMDRMTTAILLVDNESAAVTRALERFIDLGQIEIGIVSMLPNDHFIDGFDYSLSFPGQATFTLDERLEIFQSHLRYPMSKRRREVVGPSGKGLYKELFWIRELESFLNHFTFEMIPNSGKEPANE